MITLDTLALHIVEERCIVAALDRAGSVVGAAKLLHITRHALKRRIIKHRIMWPRSSSRPLPEAAPP